jgi:hypothetical protein
MKNAPLAVARACLQAYADKDRAAIEALIADDYHFTSPIDNALDRKTYFELCWPNSKTLTGFDYVCRSKMRTAPSSSMRHTRTMGRLSATARCIPSAAESLWPQRSILAGMFLTKFPRASTSKIRNKGTSDLAAIP